MTACSRCYANQFPFMWKVEPTGTVIDYAFGTCITTPDFLTPFGSLANRVVLRNEFAEFGYGDPPPTTADGEARITSPEVGGFCYAAGGAATNPGYLNVGILTAHDDCEYTNSYGSAYYVTWTLRRQTDRWVLLGHAAGLFFRGEVMDPEGTDPRKQLAFTNMLGASAGTYLDPTGWAEQIEDHYWRSAWSSTVDYGVPGPTSTSGGGGTVLLTPCALPMVTPEPEPEGLMRSSSASISETADCCVRK